MLVDTLIMVDASGIVNDNGLKPFHRSGALPPPKSSNGDFVGQTRCGQAR